MRNASFTPLVFSSLFIFLLIGPSQAQAPPNPEQLFNEVTTYTATQMRELSQKGKSSPVKTARILTGKK